MSSITTIDNKAFLTELTRLVGHSHLLTEPAKTARYRKGFRSGQGDALAVVFPGSLLELWRVLNACVSADKIILMQAANTGLTEGSTPSGNDYDRDIVIISTLRLDKLHVIGNGEQVLAYPGTTLYSLEKALKPFGRALEIAHELGVVEVALSITLTGDLAVANAIAITEDARPKPKDEKVSTKKRVAQTFKEARSVLDELEQLQNSALTEHLGDASQDTLGA